MSDRRSAADLGLGAEALLSAFPFPERDWESDARAIEARLSSSGETDALLLAAPFPSEPDEPSAPSATTTPLTNSGVRTQSLAEIARRSVEKKQQSDREMVRASLAIAQQRPSAEALRAVRESVSTLPAPSSAPPPPPSVTSAVVASSPMTQAAPSSRAAAPSPWPKVAIGMPLLALAAAALLWMRQPSEPTPLVTALLPSATHETKPVAGAAAAPTTVAEQAQPSPQGIDPSSLPGETANKPSEPTHAKSVAAGSIAPALNPSAAKPEKIVLQEEDPAPPAAVAAAAEKPVEKSLPPDPGLRPADSSGGEMPVKPSTGAVQAALGSVMSGARHCVAGDDGPSSAVVVFGSDGHVQNVSVSGPAAGKASGACIQAQLGKARVQPFAASTFSVNATIRPD